MAVNIDATFEGKLTCDFKNDMRNLANFHQDMFININLILAQLWTYECYKIICDIKKVNL